jgi:hypothetical protein
MELAGLDDLTGTCITSQIGNSARFLYATIDKPRRCLVREGIALNTSMPIFSTPESSQSRIPHQPSGKWKRGQAEFVRL